MIESIQNKFKQYRDWLMKEQSQWDYLDNQPSEQLTLNAATVTAAILSLAEVIKDNNHGRGH